MTRRSRFDWSARWTSFLMLVMATLPVCAFAGEADQSLQTARRAAESATRATTIPRDAFMAEPTVSDVKMSPDGHWLAYRYDTGQRLELRLRQLPVGDAAGERPSEQLRVMADSEGVAVFWSGDSARLWLAKRDSLDVFEIVSKAGRRILRLDDARQQTFWIVDRNSPDFALLREKVPVDGEWRYRYLRVDGIGATRVVYESRGALSSALLNADGTLRYAAGVDGTNFDTVLWRLHDAEKTELMRCPLPQQCRLVAFHGESNQSDIVWALAHNGEDLMALQRLDAGTTRWRAVHTDPRGIADAVSVMMQPDGKDWLAMAYRPDRVEWYGRTAATEAALTALQAALPRSNLGIVPTDGSRWLVQARQANWANDRYFVYDIATNKLALLFDADQRLTPPPEQLADAVPVRWRGKDGMALHGHVFLPKGTPLQTAPLIAFIHGGPYARSLAEYDPWAQLLLNRGYVVFSPNFRASTGYGVNYAKAAGGDFGKDGVLDDIVSGLDYLIANGIGNVKRQAVVGHSFGGYASLMAVTHHPERFAFAVAMAAPVDMAWTMRDIAIEGGSATSADGPPLGVLLASYGVPYAQEQWHQRMRRESALSQAANLHTPVYLWAGAQDDRVAVESLVRYVAEANSEFRPTLLIDPDAGHGPRQGLNREALAWLIEAGADRHFGGGVTPVSPELENFLRSNLRTPSQARPLALPLN